MNQNRMDELVIAEANKSIKPLEVEELDLLRKLRDNIDKQNAQQAVVQQENLEKAAIEGDAQAIAALEKQENVVVEDSKDEVVLDKPEETTQPQEEKAKK